MNIIKGLITKDLLQLKSYRKSLVIFILIFVVTGIEQGIEEMGGYISIMLTLAFGMFSIATFSYDEQAKADRYIMTLPLTRKEIVLSKYVLIMLSTIVGAILGIIVSSAIVYLNLKSLPDIQELISMAIGGIFGIGIVEAIQVPCIYKLGAERGRVQIFIVIAIIAFILGGIFFLGEKMSINLPVDLNLINQFMPMILVVVTLLMYYISYRISCKIYSKKEI